MNRKTLDYDSSSVHLARIIGTVRTYIDIMNEIAKNLNSEKIKNSFWDLIISALYDLVVIESFKLMDKKNFSVFYLITCVKTLTPENTIEIEKDQKNLQNFIADPSFLLHKHRNEQKAHKSKAPYSKLPRFADLYKVEELLALSEQLIRKYNKWINGEGYDGIDFNSIYAGGHKNMLSYISKLIKVNIDIEKTL